MMKGHDSHYVVVTPGDAHADTTIYYPTDNFKEGTLYNELVVSEHQRVLPRYVVYLTHKDNQDDGKQEIDAPLPDSSSSDEEENLDKRPVKKAKKEIKVFKMPTEKEFKEMTWDQLCPLWFEVCESDTSSISTFLRCLVDHSPMMTKDYVMSQKAEEMGIIIPSLIQILRDHPQNIQIQHYGCEAMANLAINDANNVKIRKEGGIAAVVSAMQHHFDNEHVQSVGCRAMANLAINDANAVKIGKEGGIAAIISAMQHHPNNEHVQFHGCGAMANLANNERNADEMLELGLLDDMISTLQTEDPKIWKDVLRLILSCSKRKMFKMSSPLKKRLQHLNKETDSPKLKQMIKDILLA
eukprot:TRINITY_DN1169_c0_g1_i1.p1 TRINITY_DN1169_c0_g1~~TRINITY_DN1169_c0_g1_i1.p1  ORF type:complete len:354 (-),score=69.95 TRINITY_DN1169_c0_g1_i1:50-1111(-)